MAIVFMDGFDYYNGTVATTGLQAKWRQVVSGSTSLSTTTPYSTGQALFLGGGSTFGTEVWATTLSSATSTYAIGFAFYWTGSLVNALTTNIILGLATGTYSTVQCGLSMNSSGQLCVTRGTATNNQTVLATASSSLVTSTWYYIEYIGTISSSTTVQVLVNGTQVLNATSVNNQAQAGNTANILLFKNNTVNGSSGGDFYIDDLYVSDQASSLGQRRIETIYPTADTAQKQWTASTGSNNAAMVNSPKLQTTNYVQAGTVGYQDLYTLNSLSTTPTTITALQLSSLAQKTDVGTRTIATSVKSGATSNDGSDVYLGIGYALNSRILATDPNTSAAWTASAVNSLQAGVKVTT